LLAPDKATQLLYLQIIKAILSFVSGEPGFAVRCAQRYPIG
jgi:hypothetical protein